jgi:hypothetical protein
MKPVLGQAEPIRSPRVRQKEWNRQVAKLAKSEEEVVSGQSFHSIQ